ncbi:MAG: CDP-archaeol synthase [Desulfurococcus sp.]|nr:CDP-archaeol synthase [Desulfurococcus sp.]
MALGEYIVWAAKYYLPGMIANASPLLVKGTKLIDGGKRFIDGKPVFGGHKTWEGFAIGVVNAYITGAALGFILGDPWIQVLSVITGASAMTGDLIGAFVKRRLSIPPGRPLPVVDQLSFALTITLVYFILGVEEVVKHLDFIAATLILIFILHVLTNYVAYILGIKDEKL